jgi:hypothetical protein
MIGQKFSAPKIDFWCSPPKSSRFEQMNPHQWKKLSSPQLESGLFDPCNIYDIDFTSAGGNCTISFHFLHHFFGSLITVIRFFSIFFPIFFPIFYVVNFFFLDHNLSQQIPGSLKPCSEWTYDSSMYQDTIIEKWNLVSDAQFLRQNSLATKFSLKQTNF